MGEEVVGGGYYEGWEGGVVWFGVCEDVEGGDGVG